MIHAFRILGAGYADCKIKIKKEGDVSDTIILSPAYGRDYKNKESVEADFREGKDFIFKNMIVNNQQNRFVDKPCSIRDFPKGNRFEIRYAKMMKLICLRS